MGSTSRKGTPGKNGVAGAKRGTRIRSRRAVDKAALVNKMIQSFEEKLEKKELKGTLGDFIRLLQLEKELEDEQPKEIEVRWVEPSEPGSANGE
jgi:hypothetical protein